MAVVRGGGQEQAVLEVRGDAVADRAGDLGVDGVAAVGGRRGGGDGVRRSIEFLEPMQVSLLTERRSTQPFGLHGGMPGAPGRNLLKRDGTTSELPGHSTLHLKVGDIITVETPGGGGCL